MRPGFFVLVIDDGLLVRPKFCGRGAPSNVQTDTQKLLSYQQYSPELMEALSFDGVLEPPTLVTLGYTLDGQESGTPLRSPRMPWLGDLHRSTSMGGQPWLNKERCRE